MTAQQRDTTRGARFLLAAASILLCAALAATAIRGAQQEAPVGLESADMRKIDAVLARLHGIHSKPSHHHTEDAHDSDSDSSSDSLSDDDSSRKAQLHSHAVKHAQASKGESNALAAMEAATQGLNTVDHKDAAKEQQKQKIIAQKMKALEDKINKDFHKVTAMG